MRALEASTYLNQPVSHFGSVFLRDLMPLQRVGNSHYFRAAVREVFGEPASGIDKLLHLESLVAILENLTVENARLFELFVLAFEFLQALFYFVGQAELVHFDVLVIMALHVLVAVIKPRLFDAGP